MFNFTGKTAVITGAASGIGRATAEYFLACGANVVFADLNLEACQALADQHDPDRARTLCLRYDAGSSQSADAVVAATVAHFGGLDQLATCAGIYQQSFLPEMSDEDWFKTQNINLSGVFYITRAAGRVMREGGAIATVASVAAHVGGTGGHAHYGASKGGVVAYTRGLAKDLAPRIRANSVSPGLIETPMTTGLIERSGDDIRKQILVGRYGRPSEIASVIAFLCSDAASFVNGEVIIASGGAYMG